MNPSTSKARPTALCDGRLVRLRVRSEFLAMPGLALTLCQAMRLFALDPDSCREVLSDLVDDGFLATDDGRFLRAH